MIKIIAVLLLTSICYADTHTYLINMEHFPQNRYRISVSTTNPVYRSFTDTGLKVSNQPFEISRLALNYNRKYGIFNVTFTKDSEQNLFTAMQNRSYVLLLSRTWIDAEFDSQAGGYRYHAKTEQYNALPNDFYPVVDSTGTITN